jgi:uncharacterized YceG family protein
LTVAQVGNAAFRPPPIARFCMSIFGRRNDARPRTADERERARLEREARRAAREGRPAPAPPPPPQEEPTWAPSAESVEFEVPQPPADRPPEPEAIPEPPVEPAAAPEVARPTVAEADPEVDEEPPSPTLDEELAAVDGRGWFDDGESARDEEPGQETVEWDVLANRPKSAPPPPDGPAGVDSPTVEWDVMAEQPKEPVDEDEPRFARADATGEGPGFPNPATAAAARAQQAGAAPATGRAVASRFADEGDRPVPTRRVPRSGRTLPPPPPPPGERRRRGPFRGRRAVALVTLLVVLAGLAYVVISLFQPLAGEGGATVRVDVPENATAGDIGDLLAQRGIVDSSFFFTVRARLDGASLKAGEYELRRDMSYGDAIKTLSAGPPPPKTIRLAIPEGRARRETAPLVRDAGLDGSYLAASERSSSFSTRRYGAPRGVASLEGFLFPATYELEPGSSARELVSQQLRAFRDNIAKVSMNRARRRNLTTYDVLIIASMVEREATIDRERRLIAAVIHNRLREGMPLGIDATIRYATRNWSSPLKQSELNIDSPYNTRRRTGLPPGPIGSPGLASIKAAADPASVKHLFYVVKPCGEGAHSFSSTDAEFQRDVAAYNRKRDELGGKSPVSC